MDGCYFMVKQHVLMAALVTGACPGYLCALWVVMAAECLQTIDGK